MQVLGLWSKFDKEGRKLARFLQQHRTLRRNLHLGSQLMAKTNGWNLRFDSARIDERPFMASVTSFSHDLEVGQFLD